MEAEELAIVLSRASDLHLKISDAIERAMRSQKASSAGFDSPSTVLETVSSENSASGSPRADLEGPPLSEGKPWQVSPDFRNSMRRERRANHSGAGDCLR